MIKFLPTIPSKYLSFFQRSVGALMAVTILLLLSVSFQVSQHYRDLISLYQRTLADQNSLEGQALINDQKMASVSAELEKIKNSDPQKTNEDLKNRLAQTEAAFKEASLVFELQADGKALGLNTGSVDKDLVKVLSLLSQLKYEEAKALAGSVRGKLETLAKSLKPAGTSPVAQSNTPPVSGFSKQSVKTEFGLFTVALLGSDSGSTHIIIDTAGDGDCSNNCPVLPLADYVSRNGGFAGINGGYFCPPDYASCQGKVNTFDTLVMNTRSKTVFNRAQNELTSPVPLIVINGGQVNFYEHTRQWGIDTGQSGALANHPILVRGGRAVVTESLADEKQRQRGLKGFIAKRGGQIFIGHVFNASVGEEAKVLEVLGMEEALNLDGGGSGALWAGGYKVGPGRQLPVAIILKH